MSKLHRSFTTHTQIINTASFHRLWEYHKDVDMQPPTICDFHLLERTRTAMSGAASWRENTTNWRIKGVRGLCQSEIRFSRGELHFGSHSWEKPWENTPATGQRGSRRSKRLYQFKGSTKESEASPLILHIKCVYRSSGVRLHM